MYRLERKKSVPSNSPAEIIRFFSNDKGNHGLIVFRNPADPKRTPEEVLARTQEVLAKSGFSNVLGFGSPNRDAMFPLYERMAKTFAFGET